MLDILFVQNYYEQMLGIMQISSLLKNPANGGMPVMAMVPITQISSQILPIVMIGGLFFGGIGGIFIEIGIVCYFVLTLFHLITLPVEFDASRRAKVELVSLGILSRDEMPGVNQTLNAAALTYVAAFLSSLMNLIWLVLLRGRN